MKVNHLGSSNPQTISERDNSNKTEKGGGQFAVDLLKKQGVFSRERLDSLLEEINAQGRKLASVPTYSELKAYRQLVSSFLGELVSNMYALQSQTGWDRQGRQKLYTTIKQIDDTLAGLAEDVRHGQERQLGIMAKLDAIRGMLVDIYS